MPPITRVLVANRGEIALRVIRACQALGVDSVLAVSAADRDSLPARLAGRAVCIGPARPLDSYLNVGAIITAAKGTGCDAIHPGYGFLAEQPRLAEACREAGIVFIGPEAETIARMGNKIEARRIAAALGIPVVPGSERVDGAEDAVERARAIGFPVLLKAAAGGGGRGMRIVERAEDLRPACEAASAEARSAFGDGTVYMERYIARARHVEVQVLADHFGTVLHLGERDCSSQRRYQKIVEEAPAPRLERMRQPMREAAVRLARETGYRNAGTIEFIVDQDSERFYFLEMNTRIQVEHPVTEMVTGIDIVARQIAIAGGQKLGLAQSEVTFSGHAIECRINAEAPSRGFQPSPGRITAWRAPEGPGIRVDSHCHAGYLVPPYYDSLLAKVIVHAPSRGEAIARMAEALADFEIGGIDTTVAFLRTVIQQPEFVSGETHVRWIEALLARGERP